MSHDHRKAPSAPSKAVVLGVGLLVLGFSCLSLGLLLGLVGRCCGARATAAATLPVAERTVGVGYPARGSRGLAALPMVGAMEQTAAQPRIPTWTSPAGSSGCYHPAAHERMGFGFTEEKKYWSFPVAEVSSSPSSSAPPVRLPAVAAEVSCQQPSASWQEPERVLPHVPVEQEQATHFSLEDPAVRWAAPVLEDVAGAADSVGDMPVPSDLSAAGLSASEPLEPRLTADPDMLPHAAAAPRVVSDPVPPQPELPVTRQAGTTISVAERGVAEHDLLQVVLEETSAAATGVLTDTKLNQQAKRKIQAAYALANRRAHYAAQQELIEVLRMIAQAKDAVLGQSACGVALAAGLRALDEAVDFAPRGTQLEAELDLSVLTASHRTPMVREIVTDDVLPQEMMNLYYRYAQIKLATAVAGEPAGSMALHALGKLHKQLGELEPQRHRLAARRALAYQQAAVLAHRENHLAAHELAVLLAEAGHLLDAKRMLEQVAQREPNATVLENLARVDGELGHLQLAAARQRQAERLARQGLTGKQEPQWVAPQQFAQLAAEPHVYRVPARGPQAVAARGGPLPTPQFRRSPQRSFSQEWR